jgi:hypothetical protein
MIIDRLTKNEQIGIARFLLAISNLFENISNLL